MQTAIHHSAQTAQQSKQANQPADFVPLHLETRTHVTTAVLCWHLSFKEQTARQWASAGTSPAGLTPLRVQGRLAWPVSGIRKVLGFGVTTWLTNTDNHGHEIAVGNGLLSAGTKASTKHSISSGAERAGAVMGCDLVDELWALRGRPQAEAFRALRDKLLALSKLEHFDSAAGGFAGAIVNVLEIGIAHVPTFKREES